MSKANNSRPQCPYCGDMARLCKGNEVYPHRRDLYNKNFWQCEPCDARVGVHKGSITPLGRLANGELRYWKQWAHRLFDPIWINDEITRDDAYAWLAKEMNMKKEDCHIGMMGVEQCQKVVEVCRKW